MPAGRGHLTFSSFFVALLKNFPTSSNSLKNAMHVMKQNSVVCNPNNSTVTNHIDLIRWSPHFLGLYLVSYRIFSSFSLIFCVLSMPASIAVNKPQGVSPLVFIARDEGASLLK